ncbi:MAG: aminotransferase class I/II-fold pyridoxal phosphate-dependent enzyme [Flavobacteriaceae bacterium]|jgi:O-succinylhomoserine sulfhydrylase|uniref:trans-sulfuration enzyme family protein n=1 Tax=Candidatus Arcticimaribacter forsetii TaxID=2820661 RepID=UPI0020778365|nr:aminotransferase class I/II-fold pyridoxal phosphate-dependent enzyme [Candidatus Arcticimaribacter forsetii]MCH1539079.1 aminotransferase class I/II-fold pyridoxal phosphate-dependent enzyme [Flavobacteriaceae bacterium]MDB4608623.1 aminotransferase class I/II-fold pyridoxal phosphate-dependent enzyme [Flavobacteriaceae bacterium]MDB4620821.1 aminotransferase class I/II-fold pyridoxal phosphate-dependent enzyme [Flavobacteriaceae bacterium]MDB4715031.1 aminotransferase class I/II-fold pyrid
MSQKLETKAIRTQMERSKFLEHSTPLYLTSSFIFEDAEDMRASFSEEKERNIYSRFTNPNTSEFVQKVADMEGAEDGVSFATGMGAIYGTFAALLNSGDHIVSARSIFGSTHTLFTKYFPKWNIETSYFKVEEPETIASLIKPNTKILYAETPTNPGVDILDLEYLGKIAKKHNLILIIDNCFATPYLQQPVQYGADLVIHSATKLIDGQGRVLGGVTVGNADLIREIYLFARNTGSALSPFNAWILSKSMETLPVRVDRHCESALKIATLLEKHPKINWVKYPFLKSHPQYELAKKQMSQGGNIIAFEIKGGIEAGRSFLNSIKMLSLSSNLGDSRSIVTHPASTTHSKLSEPDRLEVGITDGMIRLSVGLEHFEDINDDLNQALDTL